VTLGEEKKGLRHRYGRRFHWSGWRTWRASNCTKCIRARPHFDRPDYIVFDLDPPEEFKFAQVAELALESKTSRKFRLHAFCQDDGRKACTYWRRSNRSEDFQKHLKRRKAVAQPFVDSHASSLTLQIKKEHRKGRVLLDIYRNRQSQTIVAAYSVRGLPAHPFPPVAVGRIEFA